MADHWANAISGNFANAANWTGGVPGNLDVAVLDAVGGAYTVTDTLANTVLVGLETAANATLSIAAGGLFFPGGNLQELVNSGTILLGDGTFLQAGQTLTNSGLISLDSSGDPTDLEVLGTGLILSGGGKVQLGDNPNNAIESNAGTITTFVNESNIIAGAGQIGDAGLTIVNDADGTIKATGANPLIVTSPSFTMTNAGMLKAAGAGGLVLSDITINNGMSGKLKAKTGSTISLQNADIIGGTLATAGTGVIAVNGTAVLDGSSLAVNNTGVFEVGPGSQVAIAGGIDNTGVINLLADGVSPANLLMANNVTLTGGGQVVLSDANGNIIAGQGAFVLTNVDNTISGGGQLGAGHLVLTNLAAGVINANGAANSLTVDTGANTITNYGLMEATGSGDLKIESPIANFGVLEANGGTLEVDGPVSGSNVNLNDGHEPILVAAGTLITGAGFNQDVTFTGTTGVFEMLDSQAYDSSEFNFNGEVRGFSTTGGTSIDFRDIGFVSSNEATFSGGGLTVSDGTHTAQISLVGTDYSGSTFVASSDGHGGTIVTDPPIAPAMTSAFAHAMAGLGVAAAGQLLVGVQAQIGGRLLLSAPSAHQIA